MVRVLLTVLMHGLVFLSLWWQQAKDSAAQPNDLTTGVDYWQTSMHPMLWSILALMLLAPAAALLSCPRTSVQGRLLFVSNCLLVPVVLYLHHTQANNFVWVGWLGFSVAMLGIAVFNVLSVRVARVPSSHADK